VEFGMVGSEGLVGFSLFLTIPLTYGSAVVQHPGALYRVPADVALSQFEESPAFRRALMRYMQFLVVEAAQNSSCYRHHSIEQQLCRSLLSYRDTQGSSQLSLTHEALARTLGVRREGITLAARRLQDLGFIQYARGHVEILSPLGLQAHSCECYHVLKETRERIFRPGRGPLA
jgi:CRP-like cAMP-binding protein